MNTYKNNNLFWKSMILKIILYAVRISALITILLIFIILGLTLVTLVMRYSLFYTYILLIAIISRKNMV